MNLGISGTGAATPQVHTSVRFVGGSAIRNPVLKVIGGLRRKRTLSPPRRVTGPETSKTCVSTSDTNSKNKDKLELHGP